MISYEEEIELETTIVMVSSAIAIIDKKTLGIKTPEERELSKSLYQTRDNLKSGQWKYEDLEIIRKKCREIYNEYQNRPNSPELESLNDAK